ncbi:BMP family protein [Halorussus gelatinilyticus]|uniref:BMP family protein n=1 Tax=Halorussus gelatinilyticus TaxID=2937524 RepID=A0A8U0IES5_9EURY|nr:BMP family protein [Halorussus gelatinilyticus]UPV99576.1 BMP family protein [Halorussus gelatinilyticus]
MEKIDAGRRRMLKVGGAGLLGTGLAGCIGGGGGGGGGSTTNVGMVYATGGLGDNSFNDMAHKGVTRAEEEFSVKSKDTEPSSPSDVAALQKKLARSTNPDYELISCIGFVQTTALKKNAKNFSDQKFMVVDSVVEQDNVSSYTFKEHQGSFQVGHLAGLLTSKDFQTTASAEGTEVKASTNGDLKVGFVGGKEVPLIKKFEAGFKAGVKHANSDVKVTSAYVGGWSDPGKGQSIANSMYESGADIVYHSAGGSGNGVFKAAQNKGRYAIGVDSDQSKSLPKYSNVVLASMVKHVDNAVYRSVKRTVNGNFDGGSIHSLGLKKDGVEAVYGNKIGSEIPDSVKSKLDSSRKKIVNGDITVPTKPKNV